MFDNGQRQFLVPCGVNAVGTGADDGNRISARRQRTPVGGCIDSQRQTADDAEAFAGQRLGKVLSRLQALRCRIAATDHGQPALLEQGGIAAHVKQAGWVGDFKQGLRVGVVGEGQDVLSRLTGPLDAAVHFCYRIKIKKQVGAVADNAACSESPGGENSLG